MADFQFLADQFADKGVAIYALCTDPLEKAQVTVERQKIAFPVLYGMDGPATAETLGAWYEERRNIVQPAAFILNPAHNIAVMSYSSGAVGRLMAEESLRIITTFQKRAAAKK